MNSSKQILRLAVPSILANITIPFVGIVDTAIAGHIADAAAIGGIAIGTMLFDLLYWNFGFLRVSTAGMTAQAYGRRSDTSSLLCQSLTIAICGTLLIWILQYPFIKAALAIIPCSEPVAHFAEQYFYIRVWAAPATLSLMAIKGWFIGMQNTVKPMIMDLVVNLVNMAASYLLAVMTPLGALGVAWGTLIAQYTGLITAVCLIIHSHRLNLDSIFRKGTRFFNTELLTLNANIFVRSLCMMIVYVGFTSLASRYGDIELAVSSIMMKMFLLFSYFIDGFAYAGEALTGKYIGQRKPKELMQSVKALFFWTVGIGLVSTFIYGLFAEQSISLMTNDQTIISAARPYHIWLLLMPLISCLAFMWDGIFIGATRGAELRNCMIYSALSFVLTYALAQSMLGINALYLAYFMHLAVRTVYLSIRWISLRKQIITNE